MMSLYLALLAQSTPCLNGINELAKKAALHFWFCGWGSDGERERQIEIVGPHALGQDDAQPIEQKRLGVVGLSDAAQADLGVCRGGQDDVVRLDASELIEHGARLVADGQGSTRPW